MERIGIKRTWNYCDGIILLRRRFSKQVILDTDVEFLILDNMVDDLHFLIEEVIYDEMILDFH